METELADTWDRITETVDLISPLDLPESYRKNIARAVKILQGAGCKQIYLFGSLVTGEIHEDTDIDLAVREFPNGRYFKILGQLFYELDYPVDLIDLGRQDLFGDQLAKAGELLQIG